MSIPNDPNLERILNLTHTAANLIDKSAADHKNGGAGDRGRTLACSLMNLAQQIIDKAEPTSAPAATENYPVHTLDEDFDHFLSYSGLYNEPDDVKAKLLQAFQAAR